MESYLSTVDPADLGVEKNYFEALLRICERFEGGLEGHVRVVIEELLESFLDTERYFQDVSYDQGVSTIKADVSLVGLVWVGGWLWLVVVGLEGQREWF